MTYPDIKHNAEVNELLKKGNQNLGLLGFTDHSQAHCIHVAETAAHILKKFDYSAHDIELAKIAGYMHDIGNAINRTHHAEYGGLLANEILKQYDLSVADRITIVSAISNHDESTGGAVDPISAALIIGDKTDVRRSRVREKPKASFDIQIIYLKRLVCQRNKNLTLNLTDVIIDKNYACKIWNMKGFYKNGRGSCCNI